MDTNDDWRGMYGDWIETKDQGWHDYRLRQVSNIGVNCFIETGNFRYITEETFRRLRCAEIIPGDILIARMPKPTGRGWLVTDMPWKMITAVDVAIAKPDSSIVDPYYFLYLINFEQILRLVEQYQSRTTRPRISRSNLAMLPFRFPPIQLQRRFGEFAAPIYTMVTALNRANANLRASLNLLLPRLIAGKIEIFSTEQDFDSMASHAAAE